MAFATYFLVDSTDEDDHVGGACRLHCFLKEFFVLFANDSASRLQHDFRAARVGGHRRKRMQPELFDCQKMTFPATAPQKYGVFTVDSDQWGRNVDPLLPAAGARHCQRAGQWSVQFVQMDFNAGSICRCTGHARLNLCLPAEVGF